MIKNNSAKHNFFTFLGIDYACASYKDIRWSTSSIKSSTKPLESDADSSQGFIAPQLAQGFDLLDGMSINNPQTIQNEQCLNLNIFTPNKMAKLPVMVWIHGGGFQIGSGSLPMYNGESLAQSTNTVVVTINYRLASFGFLRLCDISNGKINSTGNEGLGDQITALKWIEQNIHFYGGDKNNITLFGESAGAMSIACLLASPKAKGLFHKAILQSGAAHTYSSVEKANEVAKAFLVSANALGYSLDDFPKMSTQSILDVQRHFLARPEIYQQFGILPFTPVIDNELLTLPPFEAIKQGSAKNIVILAGTNTDEWTLFAAMLQQNIKSPDAMNSILQGLMDVTQIPACLSLVDDELKNRQLQVTPQSRLNEVFTDYWFTQPCHRLLENHRLSGGTNFRYKLGRRTLMKKLGCTHITDIGFVFGCTDEKFHGASPRIEALRAQMQSSWGAFAHTANPSTHEASDISDNSDNSNNITASKLNWPIYGSNNKYAYTYFAHENTYIDIHTSDNIIFWSTISDSQLAAF